MKPTLVLGGLTVLLCASLVNVVSVAGEPETAWLHPDPSHSAYRLESEFQKIADGGEEEAVAWALDYLDSRSRKHRRAAEVIAALYLDPSDIPLLLKEHSRADSAGKATHAGLVIDRMIFINGSLTRALPEEGDHDSDRTILLEASLAARRGEIGELMGEADTPLLLLCRGVDPSLEYKVDGQPLEWWPCDWESGLEPELRAKMSSHGSVEVRSRILDLTGVTSSPEHWHGELGVPPVAVASVWVTFRPGTRIDYHEHGYGSLWAKYGDRWLLVDDQWLMESRS